MSGRRFAAEAALVAAAFLYGVTFPLVHDALADVTPFAYLVLRFAIAVGVMAPFTLGLARRHREDARLLLRAGLVAGVLLFGGYATQTVGLQYTSPSTSAFITGLYVMFTPMIEALVLRRRPPGRVLVSAVVGMAGLYLLTGADLDLGRGELYTLACAALFACWIVYQGGYAARLHPVPFTTVQMVVLVMIGLPATARQGVGDLSALAWFAIVFTGVACSGVALSLQLFGQQRIPPSRAALILLLEPVFAGLASFVDGERLGATGLLGAAAILVAIGFAELGPRPERVAPRVPSGAGAGVDRGRPG